MASMVSKTQKTKTIGWTDKEVGLLLDVFAEETIQIGLEKAKCPKDKKCSVPGSSEEVRTVR